MMLALLSLHTHTRAHTHSHGLMKWVQATTLFLTLQVSHVLG